MVFKTKLEKYYYKYFHCQFLAWYNVFSVGQMKITRITVFQKKCIKVVRYQQNLYTCVLVC